MNTKRYIGLISALLVALTPISCQKDLLDIKPIDFVSDAAVFQDITLTSQFVNDIYGTLLSGFERRDFGFDQDWAAGFALLDMMTDDLEGHTTVGGQLHVDPESQYVDCAYRRRPYNGY